MTQRRRKNKSDERGERPVGRPPEIIPPIPDTFENVIKALVKPVKKGQEGSKAK